MRLKDQLRDPIYKRWFATPPRPPKTPVVSNTPPWFLYVQREPEGPWSRAEVKGWKEGYRLVAKNLNKYHDLALSHKRQLFRPPVVRERSTRAKRYHFPEGSMEEYGALWCGFCRRVTLFRHFQRHHTMPLRTDPEERRCEICGARQMFAGWSFSSR